jgi:preprotein translocase subunit SecG
MLQTILLVLMVIVCVAMVGVILLQRSEGGALGMGGGGSGGFMTARGAGNLLTRTTAILAACFFCLAITLTILGNINRSATLISREAKVLHVDPLAGQKASPAAQAAAAAAAAQKQAQPTNNSLGGLETGGTLDLKPAGSVPTAPAAKAGPAPAQKAPKK